LHLARTLTSASTVPNEVYSLAVLGLLLHNHFHIVFTTLSNFGLMVTLLLIRGSSKIAL
jgi:hypothetical protein